MGAAHTHPDVEINFLREGEVTYLHGGAVCRVVGPALAVFWGGVPHQTLPPGLRGHGIWITLPLDWFLRWSLPADLQQRLLAGELVQGPTLAGDAEQFGRWVDDFRRGGLARKSVLLLEIEARLHRLAWSAPAIRRRRQLKSTASHSAPWLESVTAFIAQNYTETLVVADIAHAARLNEKYLMRAFKRHCRMGVWEYVTHLRVAHAQRLLLTTDDKIVDVASSSEVVIYNNDLVGAFSQDRWGVHNGLVFLRARRGMWGADSPAYPDISFDPPLSSVHPGFAPEGFTAGPETFVNPEFWNVVRSYDIEDHANAYSFKKYIAYNRFRWLSDDGSRRQSVFRDDGTAPREAAFQGSIAEIWGTVPQGWVERSVSFFANNRYEGWTAEDMADPRR